MNDKTLDGQTAGFIAMVINALSREIPEERMTDLMLPNRIQKLRSLLIPIFDERLTAIIGEPSEQIITYKLTSSSSSTPPTMRRVLDEAYDRKYAFLSEVEVKELLKVFHEIGRWAKTSEWFYCFPHFNSEGLFDPLFLTTNGCGITFRKRDLDEVDDALFNIRFFFRAGFDDRSNCFKP